MRPGYHAYLHKCVDTYTCLYTFMYMYLFCWSSLKSTSHRLAPDIVQASQCILSSYIHLSSRVPLYTYGRTHALHEHTHAHTHLPEAGEGISPRHTFVDCSNFLKVSSIVSLRVNLVANWHLTISTFERVDTARCRCDWVCVKLFALFKWHLHTYPRTHLCHVTSHCIRSNMKSNTTFHLFECHIQLQFITPVAHARTHTHCAHARAHIKNLRITTIQVANSVWVIALFLSDSNVMRQGVHEVIKDHILHPYWQSKQPVSTKL